jgi:hypothetical protein
MPGSAGDSIEVRELKAALEVAGKQAAMLQAKVAQAEIQRKALVESLSEAVRVSEEQVAASREVQLKLQAFGIDLFTQDENSLEQRLLKAVRDLDISQQEVERRSRQIHSLSEAFLKYVQATPEAKEGDRVAARAAIEVAGKAIEDLGAAEEAGRDLADSRIVSIDREIGLVVVDAGRGAGLRVGTPVAILRGQRPIYSAMIVDVRDSISGAVLQDRIGDVDDVAVGDGIQLLPNQANF